MLHVLGGGGSTMQREIMKTCVLRKDSRTTRQRQENIRRGNTVFTSSIVKIHIRKVPGTFDCERIKPCQA